MSNTNGGPKPGDAKRRAAQRAQSEAAVQEFAAGSVIPATGKKGPAITVDMTTGEYHRLYTFPGGETVELGRIGPNLIKQIQAEFHAIRPQPPTRRVVYAGGGVRDVPYDDDETVLETEEIRALPTEDAKIEARLYRQYRRDLESWLLQMQDRIEIALFSAVRTEPSPEQVKKFLGLGFSPDRVKQAWLNSLNTGDDPTEFFDAFMSVFEASEEDVVAAEESFPPSVADRKPEVAGSASMAESPE